MMREKMKAHPMKCNGHHGASRTIPRAYWETPSKTRSDRRIFLDPDDTTKGCRDCLEVTLLENGIETHHLQSTSCFNIFMNLEYNEDGSWSTKPPVTEAGDYIELQAQMDVIWALSVCIWPFVNSGDPSPLLIETYSEGLSS